MTTLTLRPYQNEALDAVAAAETAGTRAQLLVAATGLGKTVMFVELARRRGDRALILVHRDELVSQAVEKVESLWPEVSVGIVKAERDDVHHHVVVASVQTLSRPARLERLRAPFTDDRLLLGAAEPFGLVVVDEAHHATAPTYRTVLDGLGAGTDDGPLLVGVTATPDRGDGTGLDEVFSSIVSNHDMLWGIRAGYLSELRGLAVTANFDLGAVKVTRGDYDQGQAGRAMEDAGTPEIIAKAWQKHAAGRRTLVFTPTVAVAEAVEAEFRNAGVAAAHVSGATPLEDRRRILAGFETGEIDVVANCAVLTEGYDNPRVDCIVVARPTRSRALYTQMVGRGTRRHPDKTDCLVLDVVGATGEHSLVTVPSLFGVENPKRAAAMRDGTGEVSDLVIEDREEQVRVGRIAAAEVELFRRIRAEGIAWVRVDDERGEGITRYMRTLGTDRAGKRRPTVVIARTIPDPECREWTARLIHADRSRTDLVEAVPLATAQGVAEDWIRNNGGAGNLVAVDAPWRRRRPTEKQVAAARRWRMPIDPDWTAGELSDALDAHIARRRNR